MGNTVALMMLALPSIILYFVALAPFWEPSDVAINNMLTCNEQTYSLFDTKSLADGFVSTSA